MRFWDTILPQIQISTEADSAAVNGVYTDVGEFQKLHLQRWLVAEGTKGVSVPPGIYLRVERWHGWWQAWMVQMV